MNLARKAPWAALAGGALLLSLTPAVPAAAATAAAPAPAAARASGKQTSAKQATAKTAKKVDCAKVKCIALTFDDGPGKYAGKLLDTLKKHRAKATFFLEGQYVKARPAFVKRMAKEGHELGNHSYTHPDFTKLEDEEAIRDEILRTQDLVKKLTGKAPGLLRPPYGLTDFRVEAVATDLGLPIVLWNAGSRDWATRDKKAIHAEVMRNARRDAVVLMHDWVKGTVDAMPGLLKALKKQGYHVVTVSTLLRGRKLQPGEIYPADASTLQKDATPVDDELLEFRVEEP